MGFNEGRRNWFEFTGVAPVVGMRIAIHEDEERLATASQRFDDGKSGSGDLRRAVGARSSLPLGWRESPSRRSGRREQREHLGLCAVVHFDKARLGLIDLTVRSFVEIRPT